MNTRTLISVEIHKTYPSAINELLKGIAASNEHSKADKAPLITQNDVVGFLKINRLAYFPSSQFKWVLSDNEMQISFSNDLTKGLTLTWKEVTELNTTTEMDLVTTLS